jgi:AmmeMemoRadiSam system protein B
MCAFFVSAVAAERVRDSALAGGRYPAGPAALQAQVDEFLEQPAGGEPHGRVRALIVPHAGYAYSCPTALAVVGGWLATP